jgi:carbon monoxide dehydrogenase subunit G
VKLENSFEVPASPDETWALLDDVPRVVPCMPGAEMTEVVDEDNFKVTMHVKLGPVSLQFATDVRREKQDDRHMTLHARAREVRGRGGATATIESALESVGQGTRVVMVTDLQLQGTVASTGRGIVGDVANQLVGRFADCIAQQLQTSETPTVASHPAPPPPPPPVQPVGGLGLVVRAIFRPLLRLFHRH